LFLLMATGAGQLQMSNPELIAGVNDLATFSSTPPGPGLTAPARVAQIVGNEAPSR
jgi:X-X-X-Leu-X-X-Gly heptad repeat protein